ncbi:MAG: hypothetical protein WCP73_09100, partial [Eubacteriales bacterium]
IVYSWLIIALLGTFLTAFLYMVQYPSVIDAVYSFYFILFAVGRAVSILSSCLLLQKIKGRIFKQSAIRIILILWLIPFTVQVLSVPLYTGAANPLSIALYALLYLFMFGNLILIFIKCASLSDDVFYKHFIGANPGELIRKNNSGAL